MRTLPDPPPSTPPPLSSTPTPTLRSVSSKSRGTSPRRLPSPTSPPAISISPPPAAAISPPSSSLSGPIPRSCPGARYALRTLTLLDSVREQVRRHPAELALCTSPKEILAARAANKFAILLGIEGGHAIENSLALLRLYHALGVRYMTLTWTNSNDWAESSGDSRSRRPPHRPHPLRPPGHRRDEPPRHDGRSLPRLRPHLRRSSRRHPRPCPRLALLRPRPHPLPPQPHRRPAPRPRRQRRCLHGQLLLRLHRRALPPGLGRAEARPHRRPQVPRRRVRRTPRARPVSTSPSASTASSPRVSPAHRSLRSSTTSTTSSASRASTTSASAPTSTASAPSPRASTPPPTCPKSPPLFVIRREQWALAH